MVIPNQPYTIMQFPGLLTEAIPFYGVVPLVFYFPEATPDEQAIILNHGAYIGKLVECFTYQIGRKGKDYSDSKLKFMTG
jgi:hypothetical protein